MTRTLVDAEDAVVLAGKCVSEVVLQQATGPNDGELIFYMLRERSNENSASRGLGAGHEVIGIALALANPP